MEGVHVLFYFLAMSDEVGAEGVRIDDQQKGCKDEYKEDSGQAMRPDVDTLVVYHKQTLDDTGWRVEVNPVPIGNVGIVLHKLRRLL